MQRTSIALAIALLAACKSDTRPPAPPAAPKNPVQREMGLLLAAMQTTVTGIALGDVRGVPAAFEEVDRAKQATEAALGSGAYVPPKHADQLAHFRELDEAFHPQLEKLVEAAARNDVPATAAAFGTAMQGCQPCHAEFRQ